MKKVVLLPVLLLAIIVSVTASDPIVKNESCCPVVYETAEVNLSYDVEAFESLFSTAYFNQKTNSLHFEAHNNIKFVQVYNADGLLEYKLPVMSSKLRLSKKMFDKGDYKFSFHVEDQVDAVITYVTIQ